MIQMEGEDKRFCILIIRYLHTHLSYGTSTCHGLTELIATQSDILFMTPGRNYLIKRAF